LSARREKTLQIHNQKGRAILSIIMQHQDCDDEEIEVLESTVNRAPDNAFKTKLEIHLKKHNLAGEMNYNLDTISIVVHP